MQKIMLSGKIHFARLTACELDYEGSLEIDPELLAEAGILPYEKILVVNRTNGSRLETYAIPGEPGARVFCLNGPAARRGERGDLIIAITYAQFEPHEVRRHVPKTVHVDAQNRITSIEPCHETN